MVIPAIGVVVVDDDRGGFPILLFHQEVDDLDHESLFVEGVRVASVRILVGRRLEETDCGEIAGLYGGVEVLDVVLVVRRVPGLADGADGSLGEYERRVGRRGVVLERLMVGNVIRLRRSGDG